MFHGRLVAIYIAADGAAPMTRVEQILAAPGAGLAGDRYANSRGTFQNGNPVQSDQEVTLIEREALEAAQREYHTALDPAQSRRNLLTEGVPLNHLVGRMFRVGDVTLEGMRLCEPCGHLEKLTCEGVKKALVHRGGLRARIVSGGTLRTDDAIRPASEPGAKRQK